MFIVNSNGCAFFTFLGIVCHHKNASRWCLFAPPSPVVKCNMSAVKGDVNQYAINNGRTSNYATLLYPISRLAVIHETDEVIEAVDQIYQRCLSYPVIGLDCEWTPCKRKNQKPDVALLQIATQDGYCALFRTCFMEKVPVSLLKLMADRSILKVGVGIYQDGQFLRDKFPEMKVNSRFDLRHFSRYCNIYSRRESLAELTKALLPFELQKKNVLSYKWEKDLTEEMVQYAALDALAGILIFDKLLPMFHEQASDVPFHKTKFVQLVDKYFLDRSGPCHAFLDTKL